MLKIERNHGMGNELARKGRLLGAAALIGILLTACGGGDDGPAAASPTSTGAGASATASASAPLTAVASAKGATTLSWIPPTMNDDGTPLKLTGYRIYWGLTQDNLTNSVTLDAGLTRYVVEQLKPATYYFVATALSKDGESAPSNAIAMKVN